VDVRAAGKHLYMTPSVAFHGQTFGEDQSAGSILKGILHDPGLGSLTIVVAWVRYRGLLRLKRNFKAFRDRGGTVRVVVGIDEGGATRPGLLGIMRMSDEAYVFHDPGGGTFHPKVYLGEGPEKAVLLVGSSNLTPGGLFVNVEASTSTAFELPAEGKHPALIGARQFIAGLLEDGDACRRLTTTTVESMYADKRYRIAGHERTRQRRSARPRGADLEDIEETGYSSEHADEAGQLFAPSRRRRTAVPPLTRADRDELASLEMVEPEELEELEQPGSLGSRQSVPREQTELRGGPDEPGVPAATTDVWNKKMNRSDAQQVSEGSNPTGLLRLSESDHKIDHRTWFRQTMFRAPVVWKESVDRRGNLIELADVPFEVSISGVDRGTFTLSVDHGPHREAQQGNVPTIIHWGRELAAVLRAHDFSGRMLTLERIDGGTYRLVID
jgi:hypothetical protein